MSEAPYNLGDRVLASIGGTGTPAKGVITMVATLATGTPLYMVTFDRDKEQSGPCDILGREIA